MIQLSLESQLTIEDVFSKDDVVVSKDPTFKAHIEKGAQVVKDHFDNLGYVYGVTTGYGDDCTRAIPMDLVPELPMHLVRFHGCGLGDVLTAEQARYVMIIRLNSLCRGYSGVSYDLLSMFETLIHLGVMPVIPSEGSVGASGDLTPLSYVAAIISGERSVWYQGKIQDTKDVFNKLNITPYVLKPKEALAIMNGTAVMTALAVEAYVRSTYLVKLSSRITAMTSLAIQGNPQHFDEVIFKVKPHPGQARVARYIRGDLSKVPSNSEVYRLQDRYSTRCAPHIIGVLEDALPLFRSMIEVEINGVSDNPIITPEGQILSGGNFYGGHIAFAMDSLKTLVANIADLLDRQMAVLVDPKMNHGLNPNLSGVTGYRACINHGLKAVQIGASAWTAEALKHTMPASVFSRSTESHNQDKVSMGTIASRDALRVLQLTEQVTAAQLIAARQGLALREKMGILKSEHFTKQMLEFIDEIDQIIPFIEEDKPLEGTLRTLIQKIQEQAFNIEFDDSTQIQANPILKDQK